MESQGQEMYLIQFIIEKFKLSYLRRLPSAGTTSRQQTVATSTSDTNVLICAPTAVAAPL
jgi:hypothetical protein